MIRRAAWIPGTSRIVRYSERLSSRKTNRPYISFTDIDKAMAVRDQLNSDFWVEECVSLLADPPITGTITTSAS